MQKTCQNISSCVKLIGWMLKVPKERSHSDVIQMYNDLNIHIFKSSFSHIFPCCGHFHIEQCGSPLPSMPLLKCLEPTRGITAQSRWTKLASYQPHSHKLAAHILKLPGCRDVACGCTSQPLTHQPHPWRSLGLYVHMELPKTGIWPSLGDPAKDINPTQSSAPTRAQPENKIWHRAADTLP